MRSSKTHEVCYKPSKDISQAQERAQFCFCGGVPEFRNIIRSVLCKFLVAGTNKRSRLIISLDKELVLLQFNGNPGLVQYSEYASNLLNVVLGWLQKDENVVQINQHEFLAYRVKYHVRCSLKRGWRVL